MESLIAQLQSANNEGLTLLVRKYKHPCVQHLLMNTKCNTEEAEEIFTEAIVNLRKRVIENRPGTISNLKGYLVTTSYNMWLKQYQKQKTQSFGFRRSRALF